LFTPDRAFDMVSKAQIGKLKEPSLKLVDLVTHEMMNICKEVTLKVRKKSNFEGQIKVEFSYLGTSGDRRTDRQQSEAQEAHEDP